MHDEGLETVVAGVRCREVLADLSGYLDGELGNARIAQLRAHLAGCERCARFGGVVSAVIDELRRGFAEPITLPAATAARLHARLAAVMRE